MFAQLKKDKTQAQAPATWVSCSVTAAQEDEVVSAFPELQGGWGRFRELDLLSDDSRLTEMAEFPKDALFPSYRQHINVPYADTRDSCSSFIGWI